MKWAQNVKKISILSSLKSASFMSMSGGCQKPHKNSELYFKAWSANCKFCWFLRRYSVVGHAKSRTKAKNRNVVPSVNSWKWMAYLTHRKKGELKVKIWFLNPNHKDPPLAHAFFGAAVQLVWLNSTWQLKWPFYYNLESSRWQIRDQNNA